MWLTIVKTWLPLFPTGQPSPKASLDSAELVERPRCCLNGVIHCLCGRRLKELLHLLLAFELQSSRSVLDSLHRQVKLLACSSSNSVGRQRVKVKETVKRVYSHSGIEKVEY